jgi:hypothetical protein
VVAWLAVAVLMPIAAILDEDPASDARALADATGWDATWLVHLASVFLLVVALAVVGRTFPDGPGREWGAGRRRAPRRHRSARAAAVLVSAGLKELADTWAAAAPIALAVSMWRRAATGARGLPSPTGSPGVVGP